jgi:hypothetical protein
MTRLIRFIQLIIMQEYDSKCLKMYVITLKFAKKCLHRSPKSMKGSQIHLAPAHWKWHTPRSSVEKLSKAPIDTYQLTGDIDCTYVPALEPEMNEGWNWTTGYWQLDAKPSSIYIFHLTSTKLPVAWRQTMFTHYDQGQGFHQNYFLGYATSSSWN